MTLSDEVSSFRFRSRTLRNSQVDALTKRCDRNQELGAFHFDILLRCSGLLHTVPIVLRFVS